MTGQLDLHFSLSAESPLPADHGYLLYSALSHVLPELHRSNGVAVHPIAGRQVGDRLLALMPWSSLTLRVPDGRIGEVLPVSGQLLRVGPAELRVGAPRVVALRPGSALRSRLVTIRIKDAPSAADITEEKFLAAARRQLDALEVSEEVAITFGKRRTVRIRQKDVVGFELMLEGLSAEESLRVQEQGLGGRRHMGCGVFVPIS